MRSAVYALLQKRGLFFQILFIGYLIAIHPSLLERLSAATPSNPDPLLGWAFMLAPFLELTGFWLKYPLITHTVRTYSAKLSDWSIVVMILLPILHLAMGAFLFIVGGQIAGIQPADEAAWYWHVLYVAGFFLVIIKETGFLLMFFSLGGVEWTAKQQYPPDVLFLKRLRKVIPEVRLGDLCADALGDIFLMVFSSLGYTALWEYVGLSSPFSSSVGGVDYFFQLLGLLIYLAIVIPPLQAVYLLQGTLIPSTKRQKLWSIFQFALTLAVAFLSIVTG